MRYKKKWVMYSTRSGLEKPFKAVNKKQGSFTHEQTFACYIMKEICFLSGISRLTFDPDTAVMLITPKSLNDAFSFD